MANEALKLDLIEIFNSLSEVPLVCKDESEALKRITELGRQAMGSHACTLNYVNLEHMSLAQAACAGFDEEFEKHIAGREIRLGAASDGDFVDFDLLARGELVERYNLQSDGQGIANPKTARRYNLGSVIGYPLKSNGRLIGYFNHFSSSSEPFTPNQKRLLEIFARQAIMTIERFERFRTLDRLPSILNTLSQSLLSVSPEDFIEQISEKACQLLSVPICIVWELDKTLSKLKIVATHGVVDDEYKKIELSLDSPGVRHLSERHVGCLTDVTKASPNYYGSPDEAERRGWVSLLSAPMYVGGRLIGMLDVFTTSTRYFKDWEKDIFGAFANQAALSVQRAELTERQKQQVRERFVGEIRKVIGPISSDEQGRPEVWSELDETLDQIVEKCAMVIGSETCVLRLWNKATDELELRALYAGWQEEDLHKGHKVKVGEGISGHVAETGVTYLCGDTSGDSYHTGTIFGLGLFSVLCVPIKSGDVVIGTISVGSKKKDAFVEDHARLLESIVDSVAIAVERANLMDSLLRLAEATSRSESLEDLLDQLAQFTSSLMGGPRCLVWLLDKDRNGFSVKAYKAPEGEQIECEKWFISRAAVTDIEKLFQETDHPSLSESDKVAIRSCAAKMRELDWRSRLAVPLALKGRFLGFLEVYSYGHERRYTNWHKRQLKTLATQASIAIEDLISRKRFEKLNQIMREMTETRSVDELMRLLLDKSLELIGATRGSIGRLDLKTGKLHIVARRGEPRKLPSLMLGEGITGKAFLEERTIRAGDVCSHEWESIYKEFWDDTRSELAVPITVNKPEVRIGREVKQGSKSIGILNIESPTVEAFSESEEKTLDSLASHAALIIEKLEFDAKLAELAQAQKEIISKRNWDEIIGLVLKTISDTLGYEYVNISMVTSDSKRIKTEYLTGLPENEVENFKRMADHALDSNDIQADIARSREIEVPNVSDERFDTSIFNRFGHGRWIRVYIPMIDQSKNEVIGTVEAGNQRTYRKYIYERDVQLLKGFVDYAVQALMKSNRALLARISHEFRAPIVGIRSNASFLQRRIRELDDNLIKLKFEDMITDCEILKANVRELEHLLGSSSPVYKEEKTLVFRDVIIKTIKQLKHLVAEQGFDPSKIKYDPYDIPKIKIYVNRAKLNQVVYNLLTNAIKYAESDPHAFAVWIRVDETKDHFMIKFKDWGIGVRKGLEEKIFEEGFRTPEAMSRFVTGSGLGLTVARKIMREIGGDLVLAEIYKPTEFHLVLPKSLKEEVAR